MHDSLSVADWCSYPTGVENFKAFVEEDPFSRSARICTKFWLFSKNLIISLVLTWEGDGRC